jgi:hypothetical protein
VVAFIDDRAAAALGAAEIAEAVSARFGVGLHRRTIERVVRR